MNAAFDELMQIRAAHGGATGPTAEVGIHGTDPVFPTRFAAAETSAGVLGAIGVAVSDIVAAKTGTQEKVDVDVRHAGAALKSFAYLQRRDDDGQYHVLGNSPRAMTAYAITNPWPTRDGRWFLPHFGIAHLKERVLSVLRCETTPESVAKAVRQWDGEALEQAIAQAGACGGMIRSRDEWLAHPHGAAMALRPVVEIQKIGDSDPEPFPTDGPALAGIRVLDLTRILAGPVAARVCAEHGADVLMVAARNVPQIKNFVIDLSHGKRSCFLDLNEPDEAARLLDLVRDADVFSQGYRPQVLAARGFGPEQLAEIRPGIIYTSISCYGAEGPLSGRAGWEQVAQSVIGICDEHGEPDPALLPIPACDFLTGYLGAYGILIALGLRAREGGSYHVNVSLCQSGMFLQRQRRVDVPAGELDVPLAEVEPLLNSADTSYGHLKYLGPLVRYTHAKPGWSTPTPALGGDTPEWLRTA
ncbi:MAG: CoA transferase [Pseudomonadota bacterium]